MNGNVSLLQIKQDNLSKHCKCGGAYVNVLKITEYGQKLQTFRNIARYREYLALGDTHYILWMLNLKVDFSAL